MTQQELHEIVEGIRSPEQVSMTLAEFLEYDIEGYEYVKGELVPMSPATRAHSRISVNVIRYLDQHVRENQLGEVHVEATFQVGERGLKPDVAFVSTTRLDGDENKGFPIPPDLAIEVVSPTDAQSRIVDKAFAYLNAGTRRVWVLEPRSQTVTVYRSEKDMTLLTCEDTLTAEDVVPGFTCSVSQLFE
ncbi:Uma2 family endonuclease [Candidatus Poribacteria bacterium]|nr:Uma2 family endonuclease [Candidatus Poribacteria bacterium]MYK20547.1 Uma2 family endonuclease [Candidatus Poribacteria bacterium]